MSKTTKQLFRDNSYLKTCRATVTHLDERGVQFDQSVCYPHSGGQLGDQATLKLENGTTIHITDTQKDKHSGEQFHLIDTSACVFIPACIWFAPLSTPRLTAGPFSLIVRDWILI